MTLPWRLGPYTVAMRERPPSWPQYIITRAGKVVGHSASRPNLEQCRDIERFAVAGRYADAPVKKYSYRLKDQCKRAAAKATRSRQVNKLLGP
jgi:hypothetical protein